MASLHAEGSLLVRVTPCHQDVGNHVSRLCTILLKVIQTNTQINDTRNVDRERIIINLHIRQGDFITTVFVTPARNPAKFNFILGHRASANQQQEEMNNTITTFKPPISQLCSLYVISPILLSVYITVLLYILYYHLAELTLDTYSTYSRLYCSSFSIKMHKYIIHWQGENAIKTNGRYLQFQFL